MSKPLVDMFVGDIKVPAQMFTRPRYTGEQRLLEACLIDAIEVLHKYNHHYSLSLRAYHLYKEAWDWVHDDDRSYFACFIPVCEVLGLDASAVRAALDTEFAPYPSKAPRPRVLSKVDQRFISNRSHR